MRLLPFLQNHMRPEEVKNGLFGNWISSLISGGWFHSGSQEHLTTGHTHEDIGAFAGLLTARWFEQQTDPKIGSLLRCLLRLPDTVHSGRR